MGHESRLYVMALRSAGSVSGPIDLNQSADLKAEPKPSQLLTDNRRGFFALIAKRQTVLGLMDRGLVALSDNTLAMVSKS